MEINKFMKKVEYQFNKWFVEKEQGATHNETLISELL